MYSSDFYEEFYEDYEEDICCLIPKHKFELLKEMYIGAKRDGTIFIGELLQEEVDVIGVTDDERKNI